MSDRTDVNHFYLQVSPIHTTKFLVNLAFWLRRMFKIDFQNGGCGGHLRVFIETILASFFYLQVTLIIPSKFRVNCGYDCRLGFSIGMILATFSYFSESIICKLNLSGTPNCSIKSITWIAYGNGIKMTYLQ